MICLTCGNATEPLLTGVEIPARSATDPTGMNGSGASSYMETTRPSRCGVGSAGGGAAISPVPRDAIIVGRTSLRTVLCARWDSDHFRRAVGIRTGACRTTADHGGRSGLPAAGPLPELRGNAGVVDHLAAAAVHRVRVWGGHGDDDQAVPCLRVVDSNGDGFGEPPGVHVSAGQWFNWVVWFAIIGELGMWAVVVWVMAIRSLR